MDKMKKGYSKLQQNKIMLHIKADPLQLIL